MAKQECEIVGSVTYREGDGVQMEIPRGQAQIEITDLDATISWTDGDSHGAAAIALAELDRFIEEGTLKLL